MAFDSFRIVEASGKENICQIWNKAYSWLAGRGYVVLSFRLCFDMLRSCRLRAAQAAFALLSRREAVAPRPALEPPRDPAKAAIFTLERTGILE